MTICQSISQRILYSRDELALFLVAVPTHHVILFPSFWKQTKNTLNISPSSYNYDSSKYIFTKNGINLIYWFRWITKNVFLLFWTKFIHENVLNKKIKIIVHINQFIISAKQMTQNNKINVFIFCFHNHIILTDIR